MTVFQALVQGIIQGFTEFIPISSSGHLVLFRHFFRIQESDALFFITALHLGTLAAVIAAFWDTVKKLFFELFRLISDLFTGKFKLKSGDGTRNMMIMLIISTLPLAGAFFLKGFVETVTEASDIVFVSVCFLITGALLFFAAKAKDGGKSAAEMRLRDALLIGIAQGVAVMPGISRSGATVGAGILRGYSKDFMVVYSFILGIPAVIAASASELLGAAGSGGLGNPLPIIVGFAASAVAGFFSIKLVRRLINTGRFIVFSYYLLAVGLAVLVLGVSEKF
ncbi:MAG: undecaprenyl-diphosphate phosphatase [Oscillospiraceae bacterium]|nr:undecaprenyl-diphosphate phosphatase [Oscillospiraceae bacterium]